MTSEDVAVVDCNAWTGPWGTFPLQGDPEQVRWSLQAVGVDRICLSPLHGVWSHDPHCGNETVYAAARRWDDVDPVPVLDPTLPTWRNELARALAQPRLRLVKLLPACSRYALEDVDEFLGSLARAGVGVSVQVRLEDPRRQHPLAQVPDAPASGAAAVAARHPGLQVVIGGGAWNALLELREELQRLPNLYADVSQADGMGSLEKMVEQGVGHKLLFGSHAPFFAPLAGLARVTADLDDASAAAILGRNAAGLLAPIRSGGRRSG